MTRYGTSWGTDNLGMGLNVNLASEDFPISTGRVQDAEGNWYEEFRSGPATFTLRFRADEYGNSSLRTEIAAKFNDFYTSLLEEYGVEWSSGDEPSHVA